MSKKTSFSVTASVSASSRAGKVADTKDKFSLFLKAREIKQITTVLERIMIMPTQERRKWFRDHGDMVQESFDTMIDDSNQLFDGIRLDDETLELSQDLLVSLREAVYMLEHLSQDAQRLKG